MFLFRRFSSLNGLKKDIPQHLNKLWLGPFKFHCFFISFETFQLLKHLIRLATVRWQHHRLNRKLRAFSRKWTAAVFSDIRVTSVLQLVGMAMKAEPCSGSAGCHFRWDQLERETFLLLCANITYRWTVIIYIMLMEKRLNLHRKRNTGKVRKSFKLLFKSMTESRFGSWWLLDAFVLTLSFGFN